ncbi:MAG: hypothetical protein M1820_006879 [Bogoriella megaspora]|nr:MAG: hypothetical protein M1820_006879 [Bogoriella megaspora]
MNDALVHDDRVIYLDSKRNSPTMPNSIFSASKLLPEDQPSQLSFEPAGFNSHEHPHPAFSNPAMSTITDASDSPSSVFDPDNAAENDAQDTDPTTHDRSPEDEPQSYDLKPPPPAVSQENVEALSERLFSSDHLKAILQDPTSAARFKSFLKNYRSQDEQLLARYTESQKAAKAIDFANAVAHGMDITHNAAYLDSKFESRSKKIEEALIDEAFPSYITYRLVQLVTECLVKEITGNNAPIMREMINGLAEVYCLSDPSVPDNPLVYASEEFYRTTQYGKDYVIGRNCRFLQGPKTQQPATRRLVEAITAGQEVCETILNYRRDGSPFMNLVMVAPLYDNKGNVRYFIGCQIDVSNLIIGGRGLESFSQLLEQDRIAARFGGEQDQSSISSLRELGHFLNDDEVEVIKRRDRSYSQSDTSSRSHSQQRPSTRDERPKRRYIGIDEAQGKSLWAHPQFGSSGRLPGVYQNFLLVRPWPSLRITFTSPTMRIPGLMQSKFMDRIGGPQSTRDGILDSLAHGVGVTAKISWLTNSSGQHYQSSNGGSSASHHDSIYGSGKGGPTDGKPRWIHCTPLLGSDEKVGVWMVVMVEQEDITGQLNVLSKLNMNLNHGFESGVGSPNLGAASARYNSSKLYAEYLRREGKEGGSMGLAGGLGGGLGGGPGSKLSHKGSGSQVGRGRASDRAVERLPETAPGFKDDF